ncbi:MAG: hypothetical protein ACYTFD_05925 [Planctomycetota bacterium]
MDIPREVLLEILPAAAVSGVVLVVTWRWRARAWPVALAVGAGYATSHALARGLPALLPADATQLLFHFALAGALLGLVEASGRLPAAGTWIVRALLAGLVPWLLLRSLTRHTWETTGEAAAWLGGLGLGLLCLWSLLEWRAPRLTGFPQPLVLLIVAGGGALALQFARSGLLGQMSGALAAALGPVVLLGMLTPGLSLRRGAVPVLVLVTAALWMSGHFFAELPAASALLLAATPLVAVRRGWVSALLAVVPVAVAVYLAHAANAPDPSDPYAGFH